MKSFSSAASVSPRGILTPLRFLPLTAQTRIPSSPLMAMQPNASRFPPCPPPLTAGQVLDAIMELDNPRAKQLGCMIMAASNRIDRLWAKCSPTMLLTWLGKSQATIVDKIDVLKTVRSRPVNCLRLCIDRTTASRLPLPAWEGPVCVPPPSLGRVSFHRPLCLCLGHVPRAPL